jgi:hypothetical protein
MYPNRYTITTVLTLLFFSLSFSGLAQLGIPITIKKPKEYDERVLRSEKSDQKKFTLPRRFIQNTVTHYNYYYNANLKLNDVLEKAKEAFKDDYAELLPFYNYSLDVTAGDSIQLDSITYKSSTGIALHDLRNDWVDNLYLLWGASFYLQKKFDSAYLMFQFMNYAFAPKEKDGYYRTIGSNRDGNSAFNIATKEKTSLTRKIFSEPPSRNDAFIWQIRNFLAQDELAEAASLIVTLKNDPVFPKRLINDLHEVQAYWFYKQSMWDSAANHLVQALSNATNNQERARWQYLAAQLFEQNKNYSEAEKYYSKASSLTTDPILDIYARLASIRVNRDGGDKSIQKNVDVLEKMAKKDKYEDYRDIIYYMAAQMQLEGNNIDDALRLLLKSTQAANNNTSQRNKAFLQLATLSYDRQQYRQSYNFYDSIRLDDASIKNPDDIRARKKSLQILAVNLEVLERQDSLQRIAAMPEDERRDFVKRMVKQIRKQQGLKDDGSGNGPGIVLPDLFPPGGNQPKGEWYFYNANSRSRGQAEFRSKWGSRPNVDNWRRGGSIIGALPNMVQQQGQGAGNTAGQEADTEISFDALYNKLPLTEELMKKSNDSVQNSLFAVGKTYVQEIENCNRGTETLEQLRNKFPQFDKMDEVLFNLYYCYNKNGDASKASAIKKLMNEKHAGSNFTTIVTTGKNPEAQTGGANEATKTYERIYDLFIEGKFSRAIEEKRVADSMYKKSYWTPQLLYIEAVYYVKQREDSIATRILNNIMEQFDRSPLAAKASNLIEVLSRRKQIEEELSKMVVTRATDSTIGRIVEPVAPRIIKPQTDTTTKKPNPIVTTNNPPKPIVKTDTVAIKPVTPKVTSPTFSFNPNEAHYVVLVLNKIDPVFVSETRNAFNRHNKDTYYNKNYTSELVEIDADNRLLLISPFATANDAAAYVDKTKPVTATEIIPWLKGGKYSFTILSANNLDILKANKDLEGYKKFLDQILPGKFN